MQICYKYKRKTKSLRTNNSKEAHQRAKLIYPHLVNELISNQYNVHDVSFESLADKWLNGDHGWAQRTIKLYTEIIGNYIRTGELPVNPNTRLMHVRCINACWNWGLRQGLVTNHQKLGSTRAYPRTKILKDMGAISYWKPSEFQIFCRILVYSGARVEELRRWKKTEESYDPNKGHIRVKTKGSGQMDTGNKTRIVLVDKKLCADIDKIEGFNYSRKQISTLLKRNCSDPKLQMRDLRRTFAVNQYKKGTPMLTISRLLGHSSLSMTEWYLEPFKVEDVRWV